MAAITRVQSATATTGATNATTLSLVFGAGPTKGNIIVISSMDSAAGSNATLRPNTSANIVTWLVYAAINGSGGTNNIAVGFVAGSGAGATVTLTYDGASRPRAAVGAEYSGLNIAPDLQTVGTGNSATAVPSTIGNVNFNNELVIVTAGLQGQWATTSANPFSAPTLGSIVAQINTNNNGAGLDRAACLVEYFTTATIGNNAGTPSLTCTSGQWASVGMTFHVSTAGLRLAGHGGLAA